MSDTATIVQLPWLGVFDQDVPARTLSAISYGTGFVVFSGPPGAPDSSGEVAEGLSSVTTRLHEAGFVTTTLTAPLPRLSMLQGAISDAMKAKIASGHPLVVIVRHAETLSGATLQRLIPLAELRRDGKPVLRFLLTGTSDLWPLLHDAGLGHLEDDPAAHIRLIQPATAPAPEPASPALAVAAARPPRALVRLNAYPAGPLMHHRPDSLFFRLRESTGLVRLVLAGIGLAGVGLVGWFILASGLAPEPVVPGPVLSPDARFAALIEKEKLEIASDRLSSPPGDNLLETRRQIDELLPLVSSKVLHSLAELPGTVGSEAVHPADQPPLPAPPPVAQDAAAADAVPLGSLMHVTLRYSRGDKAAEARAGQLLDLLRSRGVLADEPEPAGTVIGPSSLAYYFDQDRAAALELAQLLPGIPQTRRPIAGRGPSAGTPLPRPGDISISIGSRSEMGEISPFSGKQP